jgi:hypothetical protein
MLADARELLVAVQPDVGWVFPGRQYELYRLAGRTAGTRKVQ